MAPPPAVPVAARTLWQLPDERFARGEPVVALTFDDGPHPTVTAAVLDVLSSAGVPASFFVVGEVAARQPELTRALVDAGHTVGIHGWSHTRYAELTDAAFDDDLDRCVTMLTAVTGSPPRYVRPSYGPIDAGRAERLVARHLVPVKWSVDPEDWRRPPPEVLEARVLDELRPGRIVLLHDGLDDSDAMVAALPGIIAGALVLGYRFVAL